MTPALSQDRRRFPRVRAVLHATYYLDGDIVPVTTENISRGGMRISIPRPISPGKVLEFIITFKGKPIEVRGRVVYLSSDQTHAGIQFDNPLRREWKDSHETSEQVPLDPMAINEKVST